MSADSLIGQQLDEYRLEALLGKGGMARVYRGLDVRLKRWVAIKVIDSPFRADSDYIMRFGREAQAIAQLEHPHIVRLYRYGEVNDLLYMAMQYIEGAPLDQVLATYREDGVFIEPDDASQMVRQMCLALDYAHSKGVIHRDVKPSNIMLNKQGSAILADFGLALLTEVGTRGEIFGTPHYMAPEQAISSAAVVPQSDLYAVGVMLYEMFTHQLPFDAANALDVAMLHMSEPPPPPREIRPDLGPDLEAVVLKTLAKKPEDRYPNGLALSKALDKALKTSPAITSSVPPPPTAPSHLSIPQRVAASLARRPLPPVPAAIAAAKPEPAPPQPPPVDAAKQGQIAAQSELTPTTTAAPVSQRSLIFLGVGIGLTIVIGMILVAALFWLFWLRGSTPEVAQQTPVAETSSAVVGGSSTTSPDGAGNLVPAEPPATTPALLAETPASSSTSTTAPSPAEPQLIADTFQNFSGAPGMWEYLWSRPNENKFQPMKYEQRQYGLCWYAEDYIRICPDSGHPGNGADIVWRWTSPIEGHINVVLSAHKIDQGGDGVTILAYHNDQSIQGQQLTPRDMEGVFQKNWLEVDVKPGDTLVIVMKRNGNAQSDHTFIQVQIYQQ